MGDSSCNIRVICRFRPINEKEKEEWEGRENKQIIRLNGKDTVEVNLPGQSAQNYTFDFVFGPDSSQVWMKFFLFQSSSSLLQEEVYNTAAKLAVQYVNHIRFNHTS